MNDSEGASMTSTSMLNISVHCFFLEKYCSPAYYNEQTEAVDESFEVLRVLLAASVEVAGRGQGMLLIPLCKLLPVAIKKCIDMTPRILLVSKNEDIVHARIFEILCAVVELVVAMLANHSDVIIANSQENSDLQATIATLLGLLSFCLDSKNLYYRFRQDRSIQREIVTHANRLQDVLQVPGCAVRESCASGDKVYYGCSLSNTNTRTEEPCTHVECCFQPGGIKHDSILIYLGLLFGNSSYGNGYKYICQILCQPEHLYSGLQLIEHLLHPLQLLKTLPIKGKGFVKDFPFADLQDTFDTMCHNLFRYLKNIKVNPAAEGSSSHNVGASQPAIETVLHQFHAARCWDSLCTKDVFVNHLQILVWESLFRRCEFLTLCEEIKATIETIPQQSLRSTVQLEGSASLEWLKQWLKEKHIMNNILNSFYDTDSLAKVTDVVKDMITKGLMLDSELLRPTVQPSYTRDLITADVLEYGLKNSVPASRKFINSILGWLELRKMSLSPLNGRRILFILSSLVADCDKERKLENRVLKLFWDHARHPKVSASDLVICLTRIAGHYGAANDKTKIPKESILQSEEEAATFLKMCSDADMSMDFTKCMSNKDDQKQLFVTKSKVWQAKECTLLLKNAVNTSPMLTQLLAFEMPLTCHEISKECLRRLGVSQHLISDLSTDAESKLASAMASAMPPELQILEMLGKDISVYSQVGSRIRKLDDEFLKMYDEFKQEEFNRLIRFLWSCEEKRRHFVSESLYLKAKMNARIERAKMTTKDILSSQDILARMIQKAEEVVKEVNDKHKDSIQRLPNSECSVCLMEFSLKRKRPCINPCGHASTCFDCAGQEYKRTKTCPLCKCGMDQKPVALPGKLYF